MEFDFRRGAVIVIFSIFMNGNDILALEKNAA